MKIFSLILLILSGVLALPMADAYAYFVRNVVPFEICVLNQNNKEIGCLSADSSHKLELKKQDFPITLHAPNGYVDNYKVTKPGCYTVGDWYGFYVTKWPCL